MEGCREAVKVIQTAFCNGPHGRFSEIQVQGRTFYSVEKPWRDNRPYESCVPLGEYKLVWRPTTTNVPHQFDGHTWYMVGETVGLVKGEKHRWGCAWHVANFCDQVKGCSGIGQSLGFGESPKTETLRWCVNRSGDTMLELLQLLGPQDHELSINSTLMG